MYSRRPTFVYGFHGTDKTIATEILLHKAKFIESNNDYDWLGRGVYFWENSVERAKQYAVESSQRKNSKIQEPFVLGAVLDLGNCLDLLDQKHLDFLQIAYELLVKDFANVGKSLPLNAGFGKNDFDFRNRKLDCAVITFAHEYAKKALGIEFDSVRSAFWEGERLYPNAGFYRHSHVQIAILNPRCIKGVFLPYE